MAVRANVPSCRVWTQDAVEDTLLDAAYRYKDAIFTPSTTPLLRYGVRVCLLVLQPTFSTFGTHILTPTDLRRTECWEMENRGLTETHMHGGLIQCPVVPDVFRP